MIQDIAVSAAMENALEEKRRHDNEQGVQQSSEKPVEGDARDIAADLGESAATQPQQDTEPGVRQSSEQPAEGE